MTVREGLQRIAAAVALLAAVLPPLAHAHELGVGTARITLRDAHLEVQAEWDLVALAALSPTELALLEPEEVATRHAALREQLRAQTRLELDGKPLPLELRALPTAEELQATAALASAAGHPHADRLPVRFEVVAPVGDARSLSFVAPPALGAVLVTFVQPASRYAAAGQPARFAVLQAEDPGSAIGRSVAASGLTAAGVLGLIWSLLRKRSAKPPDG